MSTTLSHGYFTVFECRNHYLVCFQPVKPDTRVQADGGNLLCRGPVERPRTHIGMPERRHQEVVTAAGPAPRHEPSSRAPASSRSESNLRQATDNMSADDVINETLVRPSKATVTSPHEETPVFSSSSSSQTSVMRTSRSSDATLTSRATGESDVIMCPKCDMAFAADEHLALIDHVNECCE